MFIFMKLISVLQKDTPGEHFEHAFRLRHISISSLRATNSLIALGLLVFLKRLLRRVFLR